MPVAPWSRAPGRTAAALLLGATLALTACGVTPRGVSSAATPGGSTPSSPTSESPVPPPTLRGLSVVGLGDSVMAGSACDCEPFLTRYAAALGDRTHRTPRATNLGRPGLTVPRLASQVLGPAVAASLARASVVVVTIGANDLVPLVPRWQREGCGNGCVRAATTALDAPLTVVLQRIRSMAPRHALLLVTTYWNVFEDGDVADGDYGPGFADWSDAVTAAANTRICAAARHVDATCVDLYRPFNGTGGKDPTHLLADDGDHPDAAGHAVIARALLAATPAGTP